ncbi:SDR family oxidoreductase [Yimella sp. cx-573]|nr:SDR family oxidoreductase [Yimella sp. cx-573]
MTTALVTGASAGIGKTFCEQLAAQGNDLIVVARDAARLEALKNELELAHGIQVEVLPADLADRAALQLVADRIADPQRPVDLLVNNAGFGLRKSFIHNTIEEEENHLDVLVRAVLVLSHAAAGAMRARGNGAIINVSSVASFLASGTYSAAKSWVTVFSESLAGELEGTGVTVTALCPGFTRTEFHQRAGIKAEQAAPGFMWLEADRLVRDCLADVAKGKVVSVPGPQYKLITSLLRVAPRSIVRKPKLVRRHRPNKED